MKAYKYSIEDKDLNSNNFERIGKSEMKMKKYEVYFAGGSKIRSLYANSIIEACKSLIETLDKPAKYELFESSRHLCGINDNYSICGDFVVMEA